MSLKNLDNLVAAGKLKEEPPAKSEFENLVSSARKKLTDAEVTALSFESRFELSYAAAHGLSLAALRYRGYRPDDRFIVFQCLAMTSDLSPAQIRVLSEAHNKRNKAAYEGETEVSPALVRSMISIAKLLLGYLDKLKPLKS